MQVVEDEGRRQEGCARQEGGEVRDGAETRVRWARGLAHVLHQLVRKAAGVVKREVVARARLPSTQARAVPQCLGDDKGLEISPDG